jgi:hypothetical protein
MSTEKTVVIAKKKNIQPIIDYCMDARLVCTILPKGLSADEFEVELTLAGIKQAIAFGMFAKENKLEVAGFAEQQKPKVLAPKKVESKEAPSNIITEHVPSAPEAAEPLKMENSLNFDLNVISN